MNVLIQFVAYKRYLVLQLLLESSNVFQVHPLGRVRRLCRLTSGSFYHRHGREVEEHPAELHQPHHPLHEPLQLHDHARLPGAHSVGLHSAVTCASICAVPSHSTSNFMPATFKLRISLYS